jgi:CRP-like cAMP-binding protein
MTSSSKPYGSDESVKSRSLLRRLTLSRFQLAITVMKMTTHRQTTRQRSAEWERVFHSYQPLRISYAPGEMICQGGSYVAGLHLIIEGVVSDVILAAPSEPRDTQLLTKNDLIGIEILDGAADRLATSLCRAVTPVDLLFVERKQLQRAIDDHPTLQPSLIRYLIDRFVLARTHPRSRISVDSRLCHLLLQLGAACGQPSTNGGIALPAEITPRVLGELLGVSTRQLRNARQTIEGLQLRESGIEFDRHEVHEKMATSCPTAT